MTSKQARSNVSAAAQQIGVVGILSQVQELLLRGAALFEVGSDDAEHYLRLAFVIDDARQKFVAEVDQADLRAYIKFNSELFPPATPDMPNEELK